MQDSQEALLFDIAYHLFFLVYEDEVKKLDQLLDRIDLVGVAQLELDHRHDVQVSFCCCFWILLLRLFIRMLDVLEKNLDATQCRYQVPLCNLPLGPVLATPSIVLQVSAYGGQIFVLLNEEVKVFFSWQRSFCFQLLGKF